MVQYVQNIYKGAIVKNLTLSAGFCRWLRKEFCRCTEEMMEFKKLGNVYAVRIDRGEEVVEQMTKLAESENIRTARIEGLGAADYLSTGLYDVNTQQFISHEYEEPLEITALIGNITRMDGKPYLHLHITAADSSNRTIGGHLKAVRIGGTAEIFVTVLDGEIGRKKDDITDTGLNLFDFD